MLVGYFTERPYQDPESGFFGATGRSIQDLTLSNADYDSKLGADLYNRYLDEKVYCEEVGFDAIMFNEHHSTPFCMGGVMNVEAAIVAKTTSKVKIVLNGNILPIWDDPLWLAETLATIDMISRGRLVTGWVRGGGRESVAHNAQPPFNWERFQEAHDLVVAAWTRPGPFRWEGEHYDYRYVNPWMRPYQQDPYPLMMVPGIISRNTVAWAARHKYPYVMLSTRLEPTKASFDYYREVAREEGYEAGPEHIGYLWKVHVDETEELAYETGRKFLEGPGNIFLEGSRGVVSPVLQNLPGLTDRNNLLPTGQLGFLASSRGLDQEAAAKSSRARAAQTRAKAVRGAPKATAAPAAPAGPRAGIQAATAASYDEQLANYTITTGTPKTVLPKIRHVLETLRPGSVFFWDGDGAMTHDDTMRSLRLFGSEVLPAVKEMADELGLVGPFERNPMTAPSIAPTKRAAKAPARAKRAPAKR
ncbi:MAG: LLM class flavin-dependent oxidoreductase [Chloroflexi bacterium]|nr:LLM class flavin-dependent oxidoreductase [Chloroflexota bacterium]MQC27681.1 LLM class flavin-dependent oxidoreductase [Chloroflexota bacterium]